MVSVMLVRLVGDYNTHYANECVIYIIQYNYKSNKKVR